MIINKTFTNEFIESYAGDNVDKKRIFEKVVHAFYLLEKLTTLNIKFTFKGGTSLMLLLDNFERFSTDIDIIMPFNYKEIISDKIFSLKDEVLLEIEEQKRVPRGIIKKHYKLLFNSLYDEKGSVILDIVFDDLKYKKAKEKEIKCKYLISTEPYYKVNIPNIDEMLGDKLTAFAPNTIGIKYKEVNQLQAKNTEIIKQLYDVSKLISNMKDIKVVKETYKKVCEVQCKNRNLKLNYSDCLLDTIDTCILILLEGNYNNDMDKYKQLIKGRQGIESYLINYLTISEFFQSTIDILSLCVQLHTDLSLSEESLINSKHLFGKSFRKIKAIVGSDYYSKLSKCIFLLENNILQTV